MAKNIRFRAKSLIRLITHHPKPPSDAECRWLEMQEIAYKDDSGCWKPTDRGENLWLSMRDRYVEAVQGDDTKWAFWIDRDA